MWSVGTILTGLLSFMNETAHTTGSISSTKAEKRGFAKVSLEYNLKNPMFRKLFPEYQEELRQRQIEEQVRRVHSARTAAHAHRVLSEPNPAAAHLEQALGAADTHCETPFSGAFAKLLDINETERGSCMQERAKQNSQSGARVNPEPSGRPQTPATASSMLITTAVVLLVAAILAVPFLSQTASSEAIT